MISIRKFYAAVADKEKGRLIIPAVFRASDGAPMHYNISIPNLTPERLARLEQAREVWVIFFRKNPVYVFGRKKHA
jgi:hypothetical protein